MIHPGAICHFILSGKHFFRSSKVNTLFYCICVFMHWVGVFLCENIDVLECVSLTVGGVGFLFLSFFFFLFFDNFKIVFNHMCEKALRKRKTEDSLDRRRRGQDTLEKARAGSRTCLNCCSKWFGVTRL